MRTLALLCVLLSVALIVPGCGGGGGGGDGASMSIRWVSPVADLEVEPGAQVILRYRDEDLDGPSDMTTSLFAVPEGFAGQTVQITVPRPHGAGTVQSVVWSTFTVPKGKYRIEARAIDKDSELVEEAEGRIIVSELPVTLTSPANNPLLSRGGFLKLAFTAFFPNEPVLLTWFLDQDGSLATDSDQVEILADIEDADGAPQEYIWDATGVEVGLYRLFVDIARPSLPDATLQFATRVQFGTVACAGQIGTGDTDTGLDIGTFPDGTSVVVGAWNGVSPIGHGFVTKFKSDCSVLWTKGADNETSSAFQQVRTWADGSFLVLGTMGSPGTLGRGEPNQTALPTGPFLARFMPGGPLSWATSTFLPPGTTFVDYDTTPDGGYVITGTYTGTITFSNASINTILTSLGGTDVFFARYDALGQFLRVRSAGGPGGDTIYSIRSMPDGSTMAFGGFAGSATFGPGEPGQTPLTANGPLDSFVARFQPDSNLALVTGSQVPLLGAPPGPGLLFGVFPDGACLIAGPLTGSQSFAVGTAEQTTVATTGSTMFVARFASDGTMQWAKAASDGTGTVTGTSLATFPTGAAVIVGDIGAGTLFGPGERTETTLAAGGFRAGWRASGNLGFVFPATVRATSPLSVAGFGDGSFVVGGDFFGSVTFGPGTPQETTLMTPTPRTWDSDARVAKFNGDGDF